MKLTERGYVGAARYVNMLPCQERNRGFWIGRCKEGMA